MAYRLAVRTREVAQAKFLDASAGTYADWMEHWMHSIFSPAGPHPDILNYAQLTDHDYTLMMYDAKRTLKQRDDPNKTFCT